MNRGPMGETGRRSQRGWIVVGVVAAAFIALVAFAQSQRNGNEVAVNRTIPAGSQPESSSPTGPTGPADDDLWVVRRDRWRQKFRTFMDEGRAATRGAG